jgi:hypothetical protein
VKLKPRALLYLFLFGATVGSLLDGFHTHSGTTLYTPELIWKAAWWTPFLFGMAGLSIGVSYQLVGKWFGRGRAIVSPEPTWSQLGIVLAFFSILYFASGYLPASNAIKLAVLVIGSLILFVVFARRSPLALGVAIITAFVGPMVEVILIALGAFKHLQPDIWGVPIWLPALYAAGSFTMGLIGLKIILSSGERSLP